MSHPWVLSLISFLLIVGILSIIVLQTTSAVMAMTSYMKILGMLQYFQTVGPYMLTYSDILYCEKFTDPLRQAKCFYTVPKPPATLYEAVDDMLLIYHGQLVPAVPVVENGNTYERIDPRHVPNVYQDVYYEKIHNVLSKFGIITEIDEQNSVLDGSENRVNIVTRTVAGNMFTPYIYLHYYPVVYNTQKYLLELGEDKKINITFSKLSAASFSTIPEEIKPELQIDNIPAILHYSH